MTDTVLDLIAHGDEAAPAVETHGKNALTYRALRDHVESTRATLAGHGFGTTMIAWHPSNAQKLASAGQDGLVKLWNLGANPPQCLDLKGGAAWAERLAWSGAGSFLASAAGAYINGTELSVGGGQSA